MIPTFNPTAHLRQTIESILLQDAGPGEMQIEVVDDCSTEFDVKRLVRAVGNGRVGFHRRIEPGGLCGNWNTCIDRARGHWVHILHQDDLVLPGFYRKLREGIEQAPNIGAAFCRHILMDEEGHWYFIAPLQRRTPGVIPDWLERIASTQPIQTPAIVVRRNVYGEIGGYSPELVYALDWDMWKRIAAHYPVWYEPQPLACYRTHNSSETSRLIRTGADLADVRKSIEISRSYLPAEIADRASRKAAEFFALHAFEVARERLRFSDARSAFAQIRGALRLSHSWRVIRAVIVFLGWLLKCFVIYSPRKARSLVLRTTAKYWTASKSQQSQP